MTDDEMMVAMVRAAVGKGELDWRSVLAVVKAWLADERAKALEEAAQECIKAAHKYKRRASRSDDEETKCALLEEAITAFELVPRIRALVQSALEPTP